RGHRDAQQGDGRAAIARQRGGREAMNAPVNVLMIDNFDSFTFNLVDELARRHCTLEVWRNDIALDDAMARALALPSPRLIVISPGPGSPGEAGVCIPLIRSALGRVPMFGVCLGHQAMVEALGGTV